jgi:L-fuconolactonase
VICVDSHQHYWRLARGDYGWLTPQHGPLFRDFEPEHLVESLSECQVHASVLIQAAPTEAETRFLLELARSHASIAGVVGWVDFEAVDVRERVQRLMQEGAGKLKGLRPMVQDIPDGQWLRRPSLDAAFLTMLEANLTFDALIMPSHFDVLLERMHRHPGLRAVLDHAGKPDIANGALEPWAARIEELARTTSMHCKLSGLLTQGQPRVGAADLDEYVAHIFSCFGSERVMWGSDWPVVTARTPYRQWFELALKLVHRHAPGAEPAVFRDNAVRFYGLDSVRLTVT